MFDITNRALLDAALVVGQLVALHPLGGPH